MKIICLFIMLGSATFACQEPCQGKVNFNEVRDYLIQKMPLQFGLEKSSLDFIGAYGVHEDKEELRGYGFFSKTQTAGIYSLDCDNQEDFSFQQVEMIPVLPEITNPLFSAIRTHFLWQVGYSQILNLWVSKSTLKGLPENFDHWLVLVNLPSDKDTSSWWKFVEFRSRKESLNLEVWAGAFAHPVIPEPPQTF